MKNHIVLNCYEIDIGVTGTNIGFYYTDVGVCAKEYGPIANEDDFYANEIGACATGYGITSRINLLTVNRECKPVVTLQIIAEKK